MRVDSFRFLPRSFRPMYEHAVAPEGEPAWAPFEPRLADARISLLTSAGLYVEGEQPPFDVERERREPTWGDPTWRRIPADLPAGALGMTHLHVNPADTLADRNVSLPLDRLAELAAEGVVGGAAPGHVSVMGYQGPSLEAWRTRALPEITGMLRAEGADGVILAPV